ITSSIADCYAVTVLGRNCMRFFSVFFKPTTILSLFHTVGRKDWSDFFEDCFLLFRYLRLTVSTALPHSFRNCRRQFSVPFVRVLLCSPSYHSGNNFVFTFQLRN